MKKKILSIFMAVLMLVLMLPVQALAAEEMVYLSISDDGKFVKSDMDDTMMAYVPVPISKLKEVSLEEYGLERYKTDEDKDGVEDLTVLHLYLYAHEKYYGEGAGPLAEKANGAYGSIFFTWFWGHDCNLNYYVNGEYPLMYDGWGATADTIVVNSGDFVDIMMFTSWNFYSDSGAGFHNFFKNDEIIHNIEAKSGEEVKFELKRGYGNINNGGSTEYVAAENVAVYYSKTGLYADDAKTVESSGGEVSITFPSGGKWYVWMDGQLGFDADPENIVSSPAYLEVMVESDTVLGDVDNNGSINLLDVIQLRRFLLNSAKYSLENEKAADVDNSGSINLLDVICLRRYLLNSEKYPLG